MGRTGALDNGVSLVGMAVVQREGGKGGGQTRNVSSQQARVMTSECQTNKLLTLTNTSACILKRTQRGRQSEGDRAQTHSFTSRRTE